MGSLPPLKLISQVWTFYSSGVHWFKNPATNHIESHQGIFRGKQSPTLPQMATVLHNLSHHKVSLSQRVATHRSGTRCPRDASTKGSIVQGTHHPRYALSKGRKTVDFSFGDTSVRDKNNIAPSMLVRPRPMCPRPKIFGCCIPWTKYSLAIVPLTEPSHP